MKRATTPRLAYPSSDTDISTLTRRALRDVADTAFRGSIRAVAHTLGLGYLYVWRCSAGHRRANPELVQALRDLQQRVPGLQARLHLAAGEQCGRLEILPTLLQTLPDPRERPYERQIRPDGTTRKRTEALDRKAKAEAKKPKPPRTGVLDLAALLRDED